MALLVAAGVAVVLTLVLACLAMVLGPRGERQVGDGQDPPGGAARVSKRVP